LNPSAPKIKTFATDLVEEFFWGFMRNVPCTMHIRKQTDKGNAHHQVEAAFKSFGQALGIAVERRGKIKGVPSTKGML
jgi:imidazoleglycerol-phosphate dehydratase